MAFLKKLYLYLFVWDFPSVASDAEMQTAYAVVTQSHSPISLGNAGPGNKIMASVARQISTKYGLPLLIQEEMELADPSIQYVHISKDPNRSGFSTSSWNTYEIAKLQKEFCDEKGWKRVIVVAHPDHMMRAVAVYQMLGLKAMAAPMPRRLRSYSFPGSFQFGLVGFRIRETLCRFLFWYWGYI